MRLQSSLASFLPAFPLFAAGALPAAEPAAGGLVLKSFETVVYFDDIRLAGPQKTIVLVDFEQGMGDWAGLGVSDEQAHGGRRSGNGPSTVSGKCPPPFSRWKPNCRRGSCT
ncbi:MAG: hypothetical protein GXX96_07985 [Planctomycetaceae bacterium]|nr:hypothetical protein [Planctomycetaceae bacterium]